MRRKTAKWIQHTHIFRKDEYECSVCHMLTFKAYKECPHCGSRMRGSKYDPSWVDEIEAIDAMFGD